MYFDKTKEKLGVFMSKNRKKIIALCCVFSLLLCSCGGGGGDGQDMGIDIMEAASRLTGRWVGTVQLDESNTCVANGDIAVDLSDKSYTFDISTADFKPGIIAVDQDGALYSALDSSLNSDGLFTASGLNQDISRAQLTGPNIARFGSVDGRTGKFFLSVFSCPRP